MNKQKIRIIKYLLLSINIIAVVFISTVIKTSTNLICIFSHSLEFLSNVQAISTNPTRDYFSVIFYFCALIIGYLNNGLNLLNVNSFWQYVVKGFVILLAVFIDFMRTKKKN